MSIRRPGRPLRRVAAVTVGVLLVAAPWLVDDYTLTLLSRALAVGLLAVSVAVPTGWAGLASPGQVAPYAVGAYTAANLARAGVDVGLTQLAAAGLAGAAFAALTGLVLVRAREVTFLLISLLVGVLTATAAAEWTALTGGTNGLASIAPIRPVWGTPLLTGDQAVYGYVVLLTAALVAATVAVLRSPAGLLLIGCRDSETRMRADGHPVNRYLYTAIVGAGAIAGAAGALTITATGYVSPADVGFDVAVLVLLAVAIGGATSLTGSMLGAVLIVAAQNWAGPWEGHAPLLLGLLFIAAFYVRTVRFSRRRVRPSRGEAP